MDSVSLQQKIKHLYWRAGCGPSLEDFNSTAGISSHLDKIFNAAKTFVPIALSELRKENVNIEDDMQQLSNKKKSNRKIECVKLGYITVEKLVKDESFLREKMSFFWSNHFACQTNFSLVALDYTNTIREHALGSFVDLLKAMSKCACVMTFLNTKKNKKKSPNENFARELMELFTLGRGNYTETDVKEAARAFTGWSFDKEMKFFVNKPYQDTGIKTFLGQTGNLDGDDILKIILKKKQCARFITEKIYRYFVNDKVDADRVDKLAELFYLTGYNIEKLMRVIFESDWFYDEKNIGTKIKSPVDLLAGLMKSFEVRLHQESRFLAYMRMTGQVIFHPPNVAGWPVGRGWIDNSRLMIRLNLPSWIFEKRHPVIQPEESYDAEDVMMSKDNSDMTGSLITYSFDEMKKTFTSPDANKLAEEMMCYLLLTNSKSINVKITIDKQNGNDHVKATAVHILSLPEYQLC